MQKNYFKKGIAMAMASTMIATSLFGMAPAWIARAEGEDSETTSMSGIVSLNWNSDSTATFTIADNADAVYIANSSANKVSVPAASKFMYIEDGGFGDGDNAENNKVEVDLSWLPASDQYVYVTTNEQALTDVKSKVSATAAEAKKKISVFKVAKAATLTGKYFGQISDDGVKVGKVQGVKVKDSVELSSESGYIAFSKKEGTATGVLSADELKYLKVRVGTTDLYVDQSENNDNTVSTCLNVSKFAAKGATFLFALDEEDVTGLSSLNNASDNRVADSNVVKRDSKEIKVKLPARAAAPAAKVDLSKETVTIPKDCEYRVKSVGDKEYKTVGTVNAQYNSLWQQNTEKKAQTLSVYDLVIKTTTTGLGTEVTKVTGDEQVVVEVRKSAKASAAPSKAKLLTIKAAGKTDSARLQSGKECLEFANTDSDLAISFVKQYDAGSGIVLTNATDTAYQYAIKEITNLSTDPSITSDPAKISALYDEIIEYDTDSSLIGTLKKGSDVDISNITWKKVKAKNGSKKGTATIPTTSYWKYYTDEHTLNGNYVLLYRKAIDSKSTSREEIKVINLWRAVLNPDYNIELSQTMSMKVDNTTTELSSDNVTNGIYTGKVAISSGTSSKEMVLTIDKPQFAYGKSAGISVKAYKNETCTDEASASKDVKLTVTNNERVGVTVKIAPKADKGTYYLKCCIEGVTVIIPVEITEA